MNLEPKPPNGEELLARLSHSCTEIDSCDDCDRDRLDAVEYIKSLQEAITFAIAEIKFVHDMYFDPGDHTQTRRLLSDTRTHLLNARDMRDPPPEHIGSDDQS